MCRGHSPDLAGMRTLVPGRQGTACFPFLSWAWQSGLSLARPRGSACPPACQMERLLLPSSDAPSLLPFPLPDAAEDLAGPPGMVQLNTGQGAGAGPLNHGSGRC